MFLEHDNRLSRYETAHSNILSDGKRGPCSLIIKPATGTYPLPKLLMHLMCIGPCIIAIVDE